MKNLAAKDTDNFDPQACRALIAAVVSLAVEDLKLEQGHPDRTSAERFIFGTDSQVCDSYLTILGMEPTRFRSALAQRELA